MAGFYVENFGCRATQADGAAIEQQLRERGLGRATSYHEAEIVVLNTCTVTVSADQDARAAVRRVHRANPGCEIIVTGCYAQRAPEELAALPGVTRVIGNSHKHRLAEIAFQENLSLFSANNGGTGPSSRPPRNNFVPIANLAVGGPCPVEDQRVLVSDIFAHTELLAAPVFDAGGDRTRPNLKVQDGCNNRCSFCVIPSVRGHSRSLPIERVVHEVNTLVSSGHIEVVISGINLGRWGHDLPSRPRFVDLVQTVLERTTVEKLRISSVEPMDWNDELIGLVARSPRIAKHAHVPMQSGSDAVLRRMHRKYRPWHYREKIERIRAAMLTGAIGADVMVGFPGETETEFEETRRMVEDLSFTYLHVFTYSARPGTPAADMRSQVPTPIARERNRVLREIAAEKKNAFMRKLVGTSIEAITLNSPSVVAERQAGPNNAEDIGGKASVRPFTDALTDNYLKLHVEGQHSPNRWTKVKVKAVEKGVLVGELDGRLARNSNPKDCHSDWTERPAFSRSSTS